MSLANIITSLLQKLCPGNIILSIPKPPAILFSGSVWNRNEVREYIAGLCKTNGIDRPFIYTSDTQFATADHCSMIEANQYFIDVVLPTLKQIRGVDKLYKRQSNDCEEFAAIYSTAIKQMLSDSWPDAQFCVAVIYVEKHALCAFCSDEGFFVVEPQTGEIWDAFDYPKIKTLSHVFLDR